MGGVGGSVVKTFVLSPVPGGTTCRYKVTATKERPWSRNDNDERILFAIEVGEVTGALRSPRAPHFRED